jgi:diguanylate cyclase (GGDEF)-like protein
MDGHQYHSRKPLRREKSVSKVMVVDDSKVMRYAICRILRALNHEPLEAESGERAVELYVKENPEFVLLDVTMQGIDGYETARRIRAALPEEWVPIIFLSAGEDDQDFTRAIESGGDDYLVKPVGQVVLNAKIHALQRLADMRSKLLELSKELAATNRRLEQMAQSDGLTEVANRRRLDAFLAHHVALAARQQSPLAVALFDVDYFKAYNDRYGHLGGDECLRKIAAVIKSSFPRATDLVARYGGEEFAAVLPETHVEGAKLAADKARAAVATAAIEHASSDVAGHVTISVGVTAFVPGHDTKPEDLIARADEALYRAKHTGRNRCVAM